jgi:hypothetical protein
MYRTVLTAGLDGDGPAEEIGIAIGKFCIIFVGSLAIGAVSALLIAFILKRQQTILAKRA